MAVTVTREKPYASPSGGIALLFGTAALVGGVALIISEVMAYDELSLAGLALIVLGALVLAGLYTQQPNQATAILLFGNYKGVDRTAGLRWVLFWYTRKKISLRRLNFTSEKLKVNDKRGNPIEIAANVVWHVEDAAQALFDVEDYAAFTHVQIETALRDIASRYAYDQGEGDEPTLRSDAEQVAVELQTELRDKVHLAGVAIDEARITHLAYAPEIAGAMLRRQQADAVLAAREKIVHGAVSMVERALDELSSRGVVHLDDERRAQMVSNLLVVLCAEREAQPVVNAGSLYS
jgi:regulator of protease activity HflC (stomatin/prohibitin superfamily)